MQKHNLLEILRNKNIYPTFQYKLKYGKLYYKLFIHGSMQHSSYITHFRRTFYNFMKYSNMPIYNYWLTAPTVLAGLFEIWLYT